MTVGYLLDLLIINEVRKKKLGVTLKDSTNTRAAFVNAGGKGTIV